jgi:membrane-bound lytic murein transglycosylase D
LKKILVANSLILTFIVGYLAWRDLLKPTAPDNPGQSKKIVLSYGVPVLDLPTQLDFAGERVPLEDPDVRERLDRELHVNAYWHSNTIFLLKRGARWLPEIGRILAENGIPDDFKYLAVIESDLLNKVSPSKAVGFWQLLSGTARDYGLEVGEEVDERYHPLKSTVAAAKYLKNAQNRFGTWTNAAAAYNMGVRGLQNSIARQGMKSYYDLLLNEETSRYLFRVLAVKLIFENPGHYGFHPEAEQLYIREKTRQVTVTRSIPDLRDFSFREGINYKILKRHNPWLRKNSLNVRSGRSYVVDIPISPVEHPDNRLTEADSFMLEPDSLSTEEPMRPQQE